MKLKTIKPKKIEEIMATLTPSFPLLALKNATLFPLTVLPLRVLRASTMQAVEKALLTDGVMLALSENANINGSEPLLRRYAKVGTLAKVERVSGDSKEGYQLLVRGLSRVSVEHVQAQNGYYISGGSALIDQDDLDVETRESLLKALKQITQSLLVLLPGNADEIADKVDSIHDLHLLVQICLAHMDLDFETRENFLTLNSLKQKTLNLMQHLEGKKAQLTVQHEVNGKLNERLGKQQREAILREQMRTIQEELGDPRSSQKKDYLKLILEAGMPEDVNKIAIEEFERMEAMGPQAPEASVIRNYLDLLVTLPWRDESGHTSESIDLEKAKAILKKDHEGLDDVKKKIIQKASWILPGR